MREEKHKITEEKPSCRWDASLIPHSVPVGRSLSVRLLAERDYQSRATLASSFEKRPWISFHETQRTLVGNHLRVFPSKVHLEAGFEGRSPMFPTQTSKSLPSLRCFGQSWAHRGRNECTREIQFYSQRKEQETRWRSLRLQQEIECGRWNRQLRENRASRLLVLARLRRKSRSRPRSQPSARISFQVSSPCGRAVQHIKCRDKSA